MNSKTTIKWIDGKEYRIELVEAKEQRGFTEEQCDFIASLPDNFSDLFFCNKSDFNKNLKSFSFLCDMWQNYLIAEARKRGFISGCTIKTATDMDKMKSGRLQLIGLSKLATVGRKQIIIYDNGKWVAEAIPEVKKHFWTNNSMLSMKNWERFNSLTDEEMEKIKCEPEKYDIEQTKEIIKDLTIKINKDFHFLPITQDHAKLIREILNDYLK